MPALDELIDELRGEGVVDSKGRFTLDPERAREKMRRFQLADPRRYVLELVQAAQLRGASTIDFRIDADDMVMCFDGRPFRADELENLYASIFADGDGSDDLRALRQLALGINAAMGMEPKWARIESGCVVMELHVDGADSIETRAESEAIVGTRIHVKQRLRAQVVVDFVRNMLARLGEERHIERRCIYSGIPITLDGRTIADGHRRLPEALECVPISGPGYVGSIGYVEGAAKGELRLLKDGVWISSHPLEDELCELVVVLEDSRLRKDVSQAKIVEDEAFHRLLGVAVQARWQLLGALYLRIDEVPPPSWSEASFWRRWLDRYATSGTLAHEPTLRRLAELVTWPCARGAVGSVSLAELAASVRRQGHMLFSRQRVEELAQSEEPTPVITSAADVKWLRQIFGASEVVVVDLLRERRRQRAEEAFRGRRMQTKLMPQAGMLASTPLTGPYRGEIGLVEGLRGAVFWLVKEGALLVKREVNLSIQGLVVVVEADFEPTEFFDGVVLDRAFAEIIIDLLASAADVFALALEGCEGEQQGRALALCKRYLAEIFSEEAVPAILRRFGFARGRQAQEMIDDLKERRVPRLGIGRCPGEQMHALARVPLFPTAGGERSSMAEIASSIESTGSQRVISREFALFADEGSCLLVGRGDRRILEEVFGSEVLLDEWESMRQVSEVFHVGDADDTGVPSEDLLGVLGAGLMALEGEASSDARVLSWISSISVQMSTETTVSTNFGMQARPLAGLPVAPEVPRLPEHEIIVSASLSADKAEGMIGLPRGQKSALILDLCTQGHHLGTYELPAEAPLRAIFIDPKLPVLATGEADLESKRVAQIARWCRRRVPGLLVDAVSTWGSLSVDDRAVLWAHMRPLFLYDEVRNGKRCAAAWRAIRGLPLFPDVGGKLWSVDALESHTRDGRKLRWMVEVMPGESLSDRPVLILDDEQCECLECIFELEYFAEGWLREQAQAKEFRHAPVLPDRPPEGVLIALKSTAALGLKCTLWLPDEFREDLKVDFGFADRIVASAAISSYLLGAGAVRCPERVDVDALDPRVKKSLEKQLVCLYVSLSARLVAGRLAKDLRPTAHEYLQQAARALDSAPEKLTRWQRRARESIGKALPQRPASDPGGALESRDIRAKREVREAEQREVDPLDGGGVGDENSGADGLPVVFRVIAAEASAEEALLRALCAELQLVGVDANGLLRGQQLSLRSSRGDRIAAAVEKGFEINLRHPLVALAFREICEHGRVSPILLGALTSGLFTVINWNHAQISDDHERRFVRELAAGLSGPGGA